MSYIFGPKSQNERHTIHPFLQEIVDEAIEITNFSIVQGHRTRETHEKYLKLGVTTVPYEQSQHSPLPSKAVDIVPFINGRQRWAKDKEDWKEMRYCYHLMGVIRGIAHMKRIGLRFGLDWDSDGDFDDQRFNDIWHVELKRR